MQPTASPAPDVSISQDLRHAASVLSKFYEELPMILTRLLTAGAAIIIGLLLLRLFRRLLNKHLAAYGALLALRKSGLRACRFLAGYDNGCMRESGNGFRLCCFTSCTREGLYALSRAGCRCCNLAIAPCVSESGDFFLRYKHFIAS